MTCVKTHAHTRRRARNSKDLHIIQKGEPHEVRRRGIARVTSLHLLTPQGIMVDPRKVAAIRDWPDLTNVSQLRGFLGLVQYYDAFVDHFADHAFESFGIPPN
jgi:hypothetical protein